uniref:Putative secreted protein n=1 Tax=Anopheles darlingi TaxID=43151 RepID=A0A2M4D2I6_ANODA
MGFSFFFLMILTVFSSASSATTVGTSSVIGFLGTGFRVTSSTDSLTNSFFCRGVGLRLICSTRSGSAGAGISLFITGFFPRLHGGKVASLSCSSCTGDTSSSCSGTG